MVLYLFDIDGTLLHAHGSGRAAFDEVFAVQHGIADASAGVRYGGKTDPGIIDEILMRHRGRPASPTEHAAFLDAYVPRLRALLAQHGVEVIAGVLEALQFLAAREDVALGIATGNVRRGADAKLAAADLASWFSFGGYGCDSHVRAELVRPIARSARSSWSATRSTTSPRRARVARRCARSRPAAIPPTRSATPTRS